MLQLANLAYAHPGWATHYDFTMQAAAGEITAISGPSGSGKSTLLDLIAGFIQPQSGVLTLDGRDLLSLPPEQRPLSILFQSDFLFEHLSAAANVALGLPRGTLKDSIAGKVAAALSEAGLSGMGAQRAATLSGGQKQRVALARTLLREKPILLLDEPFSALDDETRAAMRDLIKNLTVKSRWITLLVSHNPGDVEALAQRRYRMENGVLVPAVHSMSSFR